jgi:hypothetical protein
MKGLVLFTAITIAGFFNVVGVKAAQFDALMYTREAIIELTDPPALGRRPTVDPTDRLGSNIDVIASATVKLQQALDEARTGSNDRAVHLLQMAVNYGKAKLHKEARLAAQGALLKLCEDVDMAGPDCEAVPEHGSYVAP